MSKTKKRFLIFYVIVLVLWIAFIFSNSLSNGEKSTEQSNRIVEISQKIVSVFDKDAVVSSSAVRTSAHFFEFFVLGTLYAIGTLFFDNKKISLYLFSLSLALFTATIDETLQIGVGGRAAEITDVWIDFGGAFLAHLIFVLVIFIRYKKIKK